MGSKRKPIILATGASDMTDVERAMKTIQKYTKDIVLMQCNTNYTAKAENFKYINLNVLKTYSQRYPDVVLGLSDHTHGHATILGALALGARVFEKHFTDDNNREGPDHKFAMNPVTWKAMVDAANELYNAMGDGIKKIEDNERESVIVQQRAVYVQRQLSKGSIITAADIYPLRPLKTNCVYPYEMDKVIGKHILRDVMPDECLTWDIIEK